jgi:hypothetical protein
LLCGGLLRSNVTRFSCTGQVGFDQYELLSAFIARKESIITHLECDDSYLFDAMTLPGNKIKSVRRCFSRNKSINHLLKPMLHENCIVESVMGITLQNDDVLKRLVEVLLRGRVNHLGVLPFKNINESVNVLAQVFKDSRCCLRVLDIKMFNVNDVLPVTVLVDALMHENCTVVDLRVELQLTEEHGMEFGRLLTSARARPLTSMSFQSDRFATRGVCSCIRAGCALERLQLQKCDVKAIRHVLAWRETCDSFSLRELEISKVFFIVDDRFVRLMRSATCRVKLDNAKYYETDCLNVAALVFAFRTANEVARLGRQSAMRAFPQDMCRCVAEMLVP